MCCCSALWVIDGACAAAFPYAATFVDVLAAYAVAAAGAVTSTSSCLLQLLLLLLLALVLLPVCMCCAFGYTIALVSTHVLGMLMQVLLLLYVQLPSAGAACAIAFLPPCVQMSFAGVPT